MNRERWFLALLSVLVAGTTLIAFERVGAFAYLNAKGPLVFFALFNGVVFSRRTSALRS